MRLGKIIFMKLRIALLTILVGLIAACGTTESDENPIYEELREQIRRANAIEDIVDASVDAAIQVAQLGCEGIEIRMVGRPERVFVLTGASVIGYQFVNSGTRLHGTLGPGGGGSGAESMIFVAVEGRTESIVNGVTGDSRTFIFAETLVDPGYTSCQIESAPFITSRSDLMYGSIEFEEYAFD
jgi:hypothetical protein